MAKRKPSNGERKGVNLLLCRLISLYFLANDENIRLTICKPWHDYWWLGVVIFVHWGFNWLFWAQLNLGGWCCMLVRTGATLMALCFGYKPIYSKKLKCFCTMYIDICSILKLLKRNGINKNLTLKFYYLLITW